VRQKKGQEPGKSSRLKEKTQTAKIKERPKKSG